MCWRPTSLPTEKHLHCVPVWSFSLLLAFPAVVTGGESPGGPILQIGKLRPREAQNLMEVPPPCLDWLGTAYLYARLRGFRR